MPRRWASVDQLLQLLVGAEVRVDLGEVGDPVAVVAGRDVRAGALHRPVLEDRGEPDGGGAQALDVVELVDDALEVAAVVEALVGRVVARCVSRSPVRPPRSLRRVAVGEAVRQDEVELLGPRGVGAGLEQCLGGRLLAPLRRAGGREEVGARGAIGGVGAQLVNGDRRADEGEGERGDQGEQRLARISAGVSSTAFLWSLIRPHASSCRNILQYLANRVATKQSSCET